MKKSFKQLFLLMAVVMTAMVCFVFSAGAANMDEGKCGENLVWKLNDQGVLTISGKGEMEEHPWDIYKGIIKEVVIDEGVETIVESAFHDCFNLKKVSIAATVKKVKSMAFCDCVNLCGAKLPDDLQYLGSMAFSGCSSLENVNISSKIELIELFTFASCKSLKEVTIPSSVKTIEYGAFQLCENLVKLTFEDGIITIDEKAFIGCKKLDSVVIPKTVYSIGDDAFANCSALKRVEFKSENTLFPAFGSNVFWKNDEVLLVGKKDSSVHEYARLNNLKFCDLVNHNIIAVDAVEATCTSTGLTEGKKCSECGTETVKQNVIPATGKHTYSNTCDTSCNVCKSTRKITHTNKTTTTKATLNKNGKQVTKCTVCGNVSKTTTVYYPKTIKLSATSYTYNGKAKKPTVTVKDSKGKTLKKDADYTVKYSSGRKNPGKYTVTVTFKGKYSGTKKLSFTIKPKAVTLSKVTAGSKQLTANWKTVAAVTGYEVQASTSSKFTSKTTKKVTLKSAKTKKTTIKKLKKGKKYYVKVRAYKTVDGKKIYGGWSKAKSVKIK